MCNGVCVCVFVLFLCLFTLSDCLFLKFTFFVSKEMGWGVGGGEESMELDGWGSGEDLRGHEGGKTTFRICCMKNHFQ